MSVLKPRNRLVYFRVSEDEFQRFNHICESTGARSISDLARSAMQFLIRDGNNGNVDLISEKLALLELMIGDLNRTVHQLSLSLNQQVPTAAPPANVTETQGCGGNDA